MATTTIIGRRVADYPTLAGGVRQDQEGVIHAEAS